MIHFEAVDPGNWRLELAVAEEQRTFVSSMFDIFARAYAYREYHSRAFIIYDGELPIGAGLYYDCPEWDAYDLSQLFIDQRYQRRGYGRAATRLAIDEMKREGRYKKVILCYIEGNEAARQLYESFGFTETDRDGDEIIMELDI